MGSHIPRLWLPQMGADHATLTISDADRIHHLKDVLRLKAGDSVLIFNENSGEYFATVDDIKKNAISLTRNAQQRAARAEPELHFYFAPLKRQALELMIEKVTELGATHLHPVFTAHTQMRNLNHERLLAIAVDAAEQCGRLSVPSLNAPIELFAVRPNGNVFVAQESTRAQSLPMQQALAKNPETRAVLIGPEGGFSDAEDAWLAKQSGFIPISLGDNILRAETAAILACGLLRLYADAA